MLTIFFFMLLNLLLLHQLHEYKIMHLLFCKMLHKQKPKNKKLKKIINKKI